MTEKNYFGNAKKIMTKKSSFGMEQKPAPDPKEKTSFDIKKKLHSILQKRLGSI